MVLTLETRDHAHCEQLLALLRTRGFAAKEGVATFDEGVQAGPT